jgi:hypothetical protein
VNGGHAECFCVGVLETIETGEGVVGEAATRKSGLLGRSATCSRGPYIISCGEWIEGKVVVKMVN